MAMLKRTTRVAVLNAGSHCYMGPVALMVLSRTVNLVTVRVAESHSHPFRHPSERSLPGARVEWNEALQASRCRSESLASYAHWEVPRGRDGRSASLVHPRRARGWMEGAPEEGVGTLALRDGVTPLEFKDGRGDRSVIGSGTGNGNRSADDATIVERRLGGALDN
ncbi:hypothetical protein B0H19DRAFT_1083581 [Mycena capillaripes]|nr:hypothetical protein B0H19DRAFT_1083581 [Mycena capillaripes]